MCCVARGCATACVQTGQLHIDPVAAILLDSGTPGSRLWTVAGLGVQLPQHAYEEMGEICAAHGGPWCAYLEAVRRDRARELALALALGLVAVSAIALVRRLAARRAARLPLNTRAERRPGV